MLRVLEHHAGPKCSLNGAALADNATGGPTSGRDLSQTAIWAGSVAPSETIPAHIDPTVLDLKFGATVN
jgi:hypothetical protein